MQRRLRRKWVVGGTAAIAGAALLYKLYYSERIARAWRNYQKLSAALNSYNQAFIAGAEVSATISKDLQQFFQSDSTELPQSLRQLAHLCQAAETPRALPQLQHKGSFQQPTFSLMPSLANHRANKPLRCLTKSWECSSVTRDTLWSH